MKSFPRRRPALLGLLIIYALAGSYVPRLNAQASPDPVALALRESWLTTSQGPAFGLVVATNLVFVAAGRSGLQVIDIANPQFPRRIGHLATAGEARRIAIANSHVFLASSNSRFDAIDIADPNTPKQVGGCELAGTAFGMVIRGNLAYVAEGTFTYSKSGARLEVVDISNPATPRLIGGCNTSTSDYTREVAVLGDCAYLAVGSAGLQVIDISNPQDPRLIRTYPFDVVGSVHDLQVSGDFLYAASWPRGLVAMSLSDRANPTQVGGYVGSAGSVSDHLSVSGHHVFLVDQSKGMSVIDVSNPANPQLAGSYPFINGLAQQQGGGWGQSVVATNGYLFAGAVPNALYAFEFLTQLESRSISESATQLSIELSRKGARLSAESVHYRTRDGTALAGKDYVGAEGVLDFAIGESNKTFVVAILNDQVVEGDETFTIEFSNVPPGSVLEFPGLMTVKLVDNDNGFELERDIVNVEEGTTCAAFVVRRGTEQPMTVSVDFATYDRTAVAGLDYTPLAGTLTFGPDEYEKTICVPILDDTLHERDQEFLLDLSNPSPGTTLGERKTGLGIVRDNDRLLRFTTEGGGQSEDATFIRLDVRLEGATSHATTVHYTTRDGSARAGTDYVAQTGILTFAPGETLKSVIIPLLDDLEPEENEEFQVVLLDPSPGAVLGSPSIAVVSIGDNESKFFVGTPNIPGAVTAREGSTPFRESSFVLSVVRHGSTDSKQTVDFTTIDGTAKAGLDYLSVAQTLTFAPREVTKSITVSILNDQDGEFDENFQVVLSNPTGGATLTRPSTATVTIQDDDTPDGALRLTGKQTGPNEWTYDLALAPQVVFPVHQTPFYVDRPAATITLKGMFGITNATGPVTTDLPNNADGVVQGWVPEILGGGSMVRWSYRGDAMQTGTNQRQFMGFKVFTENAVDGSVCPSVKGFQRYLTPISWTVGNLIENKSGFLSGPVGPDDEGGIQFAGRCDLIRVCEAAGVATLTVTRKSGLDREVSVDFSTTDGTAKAGTDFLARAGTIKFAPGETTQRIEIPIIDELELRPDRSFLVVLHDPSPGAVLSRWRAVEVTVTDNEDSISGDYAFFYEGRTEFLQAKILRTPAGCDPKTVSVDYRTSDGTALAGLDYETVSGTLTFLPGETEKLIPIHILKDNHVELPEVFRLTLSNPSRGAVLGRYDQLNMAISESYPDQRVIEFERSNYVVNELDRRVEIAVLGPFPGERHYPASVNFDLAGSTAVEGQDYWVNGFRQAVLHSQQIRAVLTFNLNLDSVSEPDETIVLTIRPGGDFVIGARNTATITIRDSGQAATPPVTVGGISVSETNATATVQVWRGGDPTVPFKVNYSTSDHGATAGKDYTPVSGTLIFAAGEQSKSISIPILDDFDAEGSEQIQITLSDPTSGVILLQDRTGSPSLVTITDDERKVVVDPTFRPNLAGSIGEAAALPDGKLILGGRMQLAGETNSRYLVRLSTDGSPDPTFRADDGISNALASAESILVAPDGRLLVAGWLQPTNSSGFLQVLRLRADGSRDPTFDAGTGFSAPWEMDHRSALALQPDGKLLVAGDFSQANGVRRRGIARLNTNGSVDQSFTPRGGALSRSWNYIWDPAAKARVYAVAVQRDGKILIGGEFYEVNGVKRPALARLNSDGSLDTSFVPDPAVVGIQPFGPQPFGRANDIIILPDGKILVAGAFDRNNENFEYARSGIVRLNADGSRDASFDLPTFGEVSRLHALEPSGTIVMAGKFYQVGGIPRNGMARLKSDGSVDFAFDPGAGAWGVEAIAMQQDGRLVIAGGFSSIDDILRPGIARLLADGDRYRSVRLGVTPVSVNEKAAFASITLLRGGDSDQPCTVSFTTADGTAKSGQDYVAASGTIQFASGETTREIRIALLDDGFVEPAESFNVVLSNPSAGVLIESHNVAQVGILDDEVPAILDTSFAPRINARVNAAILQPDGKLVVAGQFTVVNGVLLPFIARLNPDGSTDPSFSSPFSVDGEDCCPDFRGLAIQSDGRIIAGGYGSARTALVRLNTDGSRDVSFVPPAEVANGVLKFALQADGKVVVGGVSGLLRLNPDGSRDASFNLGTGPNGEVHFVAIRSDRRIVVGGWFDMFNGVKRLRVAQLLEDGSLDASFAPSADPVGTEIDQVLALQPDGKLLVTTSALARLNTDGTWDSTFKAESVWPTLAIQSDGKLLVANYGTSARLNPDGTVDLEFLPLPVRVDHWSFKSPLPVTVMLPWPNGGVLVGGPFTSINGLNASHLALVRGNTIGISSLEFDQANYDASEHQKAASVTIKRVGDTSGIASARITASNGSAQAGKDFVATSGSVSFAPLEILKSFTLPLINNFATNGKRTVTLSLTDAIGSRVVFGRDQATLTLHDDDQAGSRDFGFDARLTLPAEDGGTVEINAIRMLPNGTFRIWGNFTAANGIERGGVAQFHSDGSLDPGPMPKQGWVYAVQSDGKYFSSSNGQFTRFNENGVSDTTFSVKTEPASNAIQVAALQPDGKIFIAGGFTSINGTHRPRLARLNIDGSLDTGFDPGPLGLEGSGSDRLAVAPDGKLLVAGAFTEFGGRPANRILRLNPDGTFDPTFSAPSRDNTGFQGNLYALVVLPDRRAVVAGSFTYRVNGVERYDIARLNEDGTLDPTFDAGLSTAWFDSSGNPMDRGVVFALELDAENRLLAGGSFTHWDRIPIGGLTRLNLERRLHPVLDSAEIVTDGFVMRIRGEVGWIYRVETSTDLVNWSVVREVPSLGTITVFRETALTADRYRFYRVARKP